ncbi:hypothetical protein TNCT_75981 [Trichonephila clavata]|uniref:Uncharacterized protein n=1 Tax=Trichonephila clavata TaxID=2740835 RepID=A0A8X6GJW7_TRICU|nr:hypothetical protein TNCT_75981 [Trichonephila clavata]
MLKLPTFAKQNFLATSPMVSTRRVSTVQVICLFGQLRLFLRIKVIATRTGFIGYHSKDRAIVPRTFQDMLDGGEVVILDILENIYICKYHGGRTVYRRRAKELLIMEPQLFGYRLVSEIHQIQLSEASENTFLSHPLSSVSAINPKDRGVLLSMGFTAWKLSPMRSKLRVSHMVDQ